MEPVGYLSQMSLNPVSTAVALDRTPDLIHKKTHLVQSVPWEIQNIDLIIEMLISVLRHCLAFTRKD